jgi:hypothetical protein
MLLSRLRSRGSNRHSHACVTPHSCPGCVQPIDESVSRIPCSNPPDFNSHSNSAIFGAYAFGSSLVPEAKTYRFLADVLNDAAIILDTLSPLLASPSLPVHFPGLRVSVLCLSASLRALCGIAAGGSKAAITLHFASPVDGSGDVGDLNAKDSSKETILALLGMLVCVNQICFMKTCANSQSYNLAWFTHRATPNFYLVDVYSSLLAGRPPSGH